MPALVKTLPAWTNRIPRLTSRFSGTASANRRGHHSNEWRRQGRRGCRLRPANRRRYRSSKSWRCSAIPAASTLNSVPVLFQEFRGVQRLQNATDNEQDVVRPEPDFPIRHQVRKRRFPPTGSDWVRAQTSIRYGWAQRCSASWNTCMGPIRSSGVRPGGAKNTTREIINLKAGLPPNHRISIRPKLGSQNVQGRRARRQAGCDPRALGSAQAVRACTPPGSLAD